FSHPRLSQQPLCKRHAKTVFLLLEHLLRQNFFHGLLENIPFLESLQLEGSGDTSGQLRQPIVEQRIANIDASELGRARHFANIVIRQSHLDVEIEDAIELAARPCPPEVFFWNR